MFLLPGAGAIVMNTRLIRPLARMVENMQGKVLDMTPCSECEGYMKAGIILMTFDPAKSEPDWNKAPIPNPYRSGGFFVIKEEAFKRLLTGKAVEFALKNRWVFVEHEAAESLGLFRMAKGGMDEKRKIEAEEVRDDQGSA